MDEANYGLQSGREILYIEEFCLHSYTYSNLPLPGYLKLMGLIWSSLAYFISIMLKSKNEEH